MADFSVDVHQLRQKLQAALEQAQQWQAQYEAQAQHRQPQAPIPGSTPVNPALPPGQDVTPEMIRAEVMQITEVGELQEQLLMARLEMLRLTQALTEEQMSHARTRQSLTTALGDAVESMGRLKNQLPPKTP